MSKNTITRAQAIEFALSAVEHTREYWETDGDWSPEKSDEIITVLKNMHTQLVKPRAKAVSKARLANENLARKVAAMLPAEGAGSKQIVGFGLPEVATTQKAAAVMRVACEMGLAEKVVDKKNITYKPVAAE
jgi:hypothetical protein